jgi:exoenzyme U
MPTTFPNSSSDIHNGSTRCPSATSTTQALLEVEPDLSLESPSLCQTIIDSLPKPILPIRRSEPIGPKESVFTEYVDGHIQLQQAADVIDTLVFSGGGAKGFAYPGMLAAIENFCYRDTNKTVRDSLQYVGGASAGAMFALFMACNMPRQQINQLTDRLDFESLLNGKHDKQGQVFPEKAWPRLAYILDKLSILNKIPGAEKLYQALSKLALTGSNALPLEQLMREQAQAALIATVDAHLPHLKDALASSQPQTLADRQQFERQQALLDRFESNYQQIKAGKPITFALLRQAHQLIPAVKEFFCTGVLDNIQPPQYVIYDADNTPDLDIVEATVVSMTLPIVFKSRAIGLPHFAADETIEAKDGGCLRNIPIGHSGKNPLVFKFEQGAPPLKDARFPTPDVLKAKFADWASGVPNTAADAWQEKELKQKGIVDKIIHVPMKIAAGDFTEATTQFDMPEQDRQALQAKLYETVMQHLNRQLATQTIRYKNRQEAWLSLDLSTLSSLAQQQWPEADQILAWRKQVNLHLQDLEQAIQTMDTLDLAHVAIQAALQGLDEAALSMPKEGTAYIVKLFTQRDNIALQRLLNFYRYQARPTPWPTGNILDKACEHSQYMDVVNIVRNFEREVIYPARFKFHQSRHNLKLLDEIEKMGEQAATQADINQMAARLAKEYKPRFSVASSSKTATLAQHYIK